jgi:hypothetical protein
MPKLFFGNDATRVIRVPTDLRSYLPADKRHHYRDGYSMAEAAKSWVNARGRLPSSLAKLVGSDLLQAAYFEYCVNVWGGGLSMTDVMAFIPDGLIAVEAKARETFDDHVQAWIDKKARENPRSPPHRRGVIDRYSRAFGINRDALLDLRYQLLQRTLAAALTAKQFGRRSTWMLVQSFAPLSCDEHARNRADFDRYAATVGEAPVLEGIPVRLGWVDEN